MPAPIDQWITKRSVNANNIGKAEVERLLKPGAANRFKQEGPEFWRPANQPIRCLKDLANAQKRLQRLQQAQDGARARGKRTVCKQRMTPFLCAKPVALAKRSKPANAKESEANARRRKSSANELERMPHAPGRQYNFVDPDSRVMRDKRAKMLCGRLTMLRSQWTHTPKFIVAAELTQTNRKIGSSCCRL